MFSWRLVSRRRTLSVRRRAEGGTALVHPHVPSDPVYSCGEWASDYANRADITSRHVPLSGSKWGSSYVIHQRRYLCHTHVNRERARHVRTIIFLRSNVSDANCGRHTYNHFPSMHVRLILFPNAISCCE